MTERAIRILCFEPLSLPQEGRSVAQVCILIPLSTADMNSRFPARWPPCLRVVKSASACRTACLVLEQKLVVTIKSSLLLSLLVTDVSWSLSDRSVWSFSVSCGSLPLLSFPAKSRTVLSECYSLTPITLAQSLQGSIRWLQEPSMVNKADGPDIVVSIARPTTVFAPLQVVTDSKSQATLTVHDHKPVHPAAVQVAVVSLLHT